MSFLKSCFKGLLQSAEDPRESTIYTDERQREMLVRVRALLRDVDQSRQQLIAKTAVLAKKMDKLETHACKSLENGREDLARRCILQQHRLSVEQQTFQAQINAYDQKERKLLQAEHRLLTQIEAYLARRAALQRRHKQSESQVILNKGLKKVFDDLSDLDELIDIAETETDYIEARASILSDDIETRLLLNPATYPVIVEPEVQSTIDQQVELELARLRVQVGEE